MDRTIPGRFSPASGSARRTSTAAPARPRRSAPDNFGGSINLLSRDLESSPDVRAYSSYGSFNTRLLGLQLDSGQFGFGGDKKSSLFVDLHQLLSDGYETYNSPEECVAGSL